MKKELQDDLYKRFPKIFRQKDLPMTETCMCWGIDVGDGWYGIVESLCEVIQHHCDIIGVQVEAEQVKEKFGELRFYTSTIGKPLTWTQRVLNWFRRVILRRRPTFAVDVFDVCTDMATILSRKTCEECGAPGSTTGKTWIITLCSQCEKKRKKGGRKWT